MLALLGKGSLQGLDLLPLTVTLGVDGVDVVELAFPVAACGGVLLLPFLAKGADGGIGPVLGEALVHLRHLVAHGLVAGIGKGHVDAVRDNGLSFLLSLEGLADEVGQAHDNGDDDDGEDILWLLEINLVHDALCFRFFTIISS